MAFEKNEQRKKFTPIDVVRDCKRKAQAVYEDACDLSHNKHISIHGKREAEISKGVSKVIVETLLLIEEKIKGL